MARKRDIAPQLWENEQLGSVSTEARLLFIACISLADDEGRLKGSPRYLKGQAFRYDTRLSDAKVAGWRDQLIGVGLVCLYEVGESQYIHLPTWSKWQKVSHAYESMLPECPNECHSRTFENVPEDSRTFAPTDTDTDTEPVPDPEPGPDPDTDKQRGRRRKVPKVELTDDEWRRVKAVIRTIQPYELDENPAFWRKVLDKYGDPLDLEEEALKAADWIRRHRKRTFTAGYFLTWLRNAMKDHEQRRNGTNHTTESTYRSPSGRARI